MSGRDSFGRLLTGLCSDCNADARTVEIAPNVTVLEVLHDDTCPSLRAPEDGRHA